MLRSRLANGTTTTHVTFGALLVADTLLLGASAHWSSPGVSKGAVNAGTSVPRVRLAEGREPTGLYPGGSRVATVRIGDGEAYGERHERLTAEVKEVENGARSEGEARAQAKCWPGWFEVSEVGVKGPSQARAMTVARAPLERSVTLRMKEVDGNQDGCEGKEITLAYRVG